MSLPPHAREELIAQLRRALASPEYGAIGGVESEGRFTIDATHALNKRGRSSLACPSEYVLLLVQSAVAAGARTLQIDATHHSSVFVHDGKPPTPEQLTHLLGSVADDARSRDDRSRVRLAIGLNAALAENAHIELYVRYGNTLVRVEVRRDGVVIDPHMSASLSVNWNVRLIVRRERPQREEELALLRKRCVYAPLAVVVNERVVNLMAFGAPTQMSVAQEMLGGVRRALRLPGRRSRDVRWAAPYGIGLPLPPGWFRGGRRMDEATLIFEDPAQKQLRTCRLSDPVEWHAGIYAAVMVRPLPTQVRTPLHALVADGVTLEDESLPPEFDGTATLRAVDDLPTDLSQFKLVHGSEYAAMLGDLRRRLDVFNSVGTAE